MAKAVQGSFLVTQASEGSCRNEASHVEWQALQVKKRKANLCSAPCNFFSDMLYSYRY